MENYANTLRSACYGGDQMACRQASYAGASVQGERCQRYSEIRSNAFMTGGLIGMAASNNPRPDGC
jgi:hypothetical protein